MKRFMVDLLFVHRSSFVVGRACDPYGPSLLFCLFLVMLHMVLIVIIVIVIAVSVAFVLLGNAV